MTPIPLPGFDPPAPPRPTTRHRFGLLQDVDMPDDVGGEHKARVATCRWCGCMRRDANTGARLGAKRAWSMDGIDWKGASPPCVRKRGD